VWLGKAVPGPIRDRHGRPIEGETVPARLWRDFVRESLHGRPEAPLPKPAHVGRVDVGDAGRRHPAAKNPDAVANGRATDPGYAPVVHTAHPGKRLALTFDDGPSDDTPQVLDLLKKYGIKATFCMVGEEVQRYPELVRRVVAEGHELCNHSWKHDDLGTMSAAAARDDIERTDAAIAAAAPGVTVPFFRAPYGSWGHSAKEGVKAGHTPLGWVVDPDDWLLPGADVIADRIEQQLTPRAVVLVHDGGGDRKQTVEALRKLIPKLKGEGWTFDLPERTVASKPLTAAPSPSASPSASPSPSPSPSDSPSPEPSQSNQEETRAGSTS
jgi:peptidoglycan/xylan/chitin deacetylase (PgdA/CDA1 family)